MLATGVFPLVVENRDFLVINWSQNKSCSNNTVERFPMLLSSAAVGVPEEKPTICGGKDENGN